MNGADAKRKCGFALVSSVWTNPDMVLMALRLRNPEADDALMSQQLLQQGVVAPALSPQAVGQRVQSWRGFLLGYAQVPVEDMHALVGKLARVIRGNASPRITRRSSYPLAAQSVVRARHLRIGHPPVRNG